MSEIFENGVPVVWMCTCLGDASTVEFEKYFEMQGYNVEFIEEFEDKNNHKNILFLLKNKVSKFAMFRLKHLDMKWWDDYIVNYYDIIPQEIKERYDVEEVEL